MPIDLEQSLENLKLERDAIQLYDALATIEKDPARASSIKVFGTSPKQGKKLPDEFDPTGVTWVPVAGS